MRILIRIQIQGFYDQKYKKYLQLKFFIYFLIKNCYLLILIFHFHKISPSYRRILQPSKKNIQHFKTWNFSTFIVLWVILPSWIRIQPNKIIADPCGTGSETLYSGFQNSNQNAWTIDNEKVTNFCLLDYHNFHKFKFDVLHLCMFSYRIWLIWNFKAFVSVSVWYRTENGQP